MFYIMFIKEYFVTELPSLKSGTQKLNNMRWTWMGSDNMQLYFMLSLHFLTELPTIKKVNIEKDITNWSQN